MNRKDQTDDGSIAIIGFALKAPGGADSTQSFWNMMVEGHCTVSDLPASRFNVDAFWDPNPNVLGTMRSRKAHLLKEDISLFDAAFFGVSDAEAISMDPQQRLLLETTYQAFENAGITNAEFRGSNTSVHVGCSADDYKILIQKGPERMPKYSATGVTASMLSGRLSSWFDLRGPSVTIDTACSSSLVALDQACRTLQLGKASMGVVGGCNLIYTVENSIGLSQMGFMSPDGICHSFDARANGYARAEGFGVVIIKPLSSAIMNGDTIRAVVRATGINQDGGSPLAMPNKKSQSRLIVDTYRDAGLDLSATRYVEAHGPGTSVGDPIETSAIGHAFGAGKNKRDPIFVASLKSGFGHMEGCAGLVSIIKTALVLERGIIPPVVGLETLNPDIDAEFLNLRFPKVATAWPDDGPRRASINSFGFSGTNAHVVIDDAYHYLQQRGLYASHNTATAPNETGSSTSLTKNLMNSAPNDQPTLLLWSAFDQHSLEQMVADYKQWFENEASNNPTSKWVQDLAHTLLRRRTIFPWRSYTITHPSSTKLGNITKPVQSSQVSELSLAFVFTGQGAQWHGMGHELCTYEVFRESVKLGSHYLQSLGAEDDMKEFIYGNIEDSSRITAPAVAQPLCTILQVALVDLLASMNLLPSVVVGHSSGEIAAAYACGAISRASAWRIAYYRGVCSNKVATSSTKSGAMMAIGLSEDKVLEYLRQFQAEIRSKLDVRVACINSPSNITISGDSLQIQSLAALAKQSGTFHRILKVPVAYHSPHMEDIAGEYEALIGDINPGHDTKHHVNMVSSVSGKRIEKQELRDPSYWAKNLKSPVKFMQAFQNICSQSRPGLIAKLDRSHLKQYWATDLLEIGPHAALSGPIRECLQGLPEPRQVAYQSLITRNKESCTTFMDAVARLYCRGYPALAYKLNGDSSKNTQCLSTLPAYPFNHTRSFWNQSTLNEAYLFRKYPKNDFIGIVTAGSSSLDSRWRFNLNCTNSLWVMDHQIGSGFLLPAAGMLVMAIEAAVQLAGDVEISAFEITDATFSAAIEVPEHNEGTELQLQMTQIRPEERFKLPKYSFSLKICRSGDEVESCRGNIRANRKHPTNEVDMNNEEYYLNKRAKSRFEEWRGRCTGRVTAGEELYSRARKFGYNFGPSFLRIEEAGISSSNEGYSKVTSLPTTDRMVPTVIHPATLDAVFQVILPLLLPTFENGSRTTALPTRIRKLWIRRHGLVHTEPITLEEVAKYEILSTRVAKYDAVAMSPQRELMVSLEGAEFTSIGDPGSLAVTAPEKQDCICLSISKKPDIQAMARTQLDAFVMRNMDHRALSPKFWSIALREFNEALHSTLQRFEESDTKLTGHLRLYHQWMLLQVSKNPVSMNGDNVALVHDPKDISKATAHLQLGQRIKEQMFGMLTGEIDPLSLLFQDSIIDDFYKECTINADWLGPLDRYLELLCHKNPALKILEIGAGTGGTTKYVLDTLCTDSFNAKLGRYSQYCFTDISPLFFAKAKESLTNYPKLHFMTLDIEVDPCTQQFEERSFDVIIAALVLHATRSIERTLANVQKLLKPGGKLILVEIVVPGEPWTGTIFGLLPGWWLSEEKLRQQRLSPILTTEEWHQALLECGLSGVDHEFFDKLDPTYRTISLIISTKPEANILPSASIPAVLVSFDEFDEIATEAQKHLEELGCPVSRLDLATAALSGPLDTKLCVIIDSMSSSILQTLSSESFIQLKEVLQQAKNVLWIFPNTAGAVLTSGGEVYGLARTMRTEDVSMRFTVLEITSEIHENDTSTALRSAIHACLSPEQAPSEPEMLEKEGLLYVPRVTEDAGLNHFISTSKQSAVLKELPFHKENLQLAVGTPGLLDTLHFTKAPPISSKLSHGEAEVTVKAVGINFRDTLVALGRIPHDILGFECAGTVSDVGPGCRFQPGDRVMAFVSGAFSSRVRISDENVARIPCDIGFAEAAKIPTIFVTAYHALIEVGRLEHGESILIHAAAGGTGQAAVQIAQHVGAEVYVTVGNPAKKELLMETYGIPESHIFYSRDSSFSEGVKYTTGGRGVDVVLNSLSGDELRASWDLVAPNGRFLEIGKRDILAHESIPMFQFAKNVTFSAIDITTLPEKKLNRALTAVAGLFEEDVLRSVHPLCVYPIQEVESAFRYLQSGANAGCVAVEVGEDAVVQALIPPSLDRVFLPDATYVVAGGLGGLGRSIARWMVKKGARSLLLLSRRGYLAADSEEFLSSLRAEAVRVEAPPCDIADASSVERVIRDASNTMPPIRGCIQAAMVIKDALFPSMTHDDWLGATNPKIRGSWNLHVNLPVDLDFFVLLSSMAGIVGAAGQANYNAGNTYQDALAAHRLANRQKAISINLTIIEEEGYVASLGENATFNPQLKHLRAMSMAELFTILEHSCDPNLDIEQMQSQVLTGIKLPGEYGESGTPEFMHRSLYFHLFQIESGHGPAATSDASAQAQSDLTTLVSTMSSDEAGPIIALAIRSAMARILSRPVDEIDVGIPMHAHGVDSLVAVELRNWFSKSLKMDVKIFDILGGTVELLSASVTKALYES